MSDGEFETVRSDLNFIQSGIGEINLKVGELSNALNTKVNNDCSYTTTQISKSEIELLNSAFIHFDRLCLALKKELNNILLVGEGIDRLDKDLSNESVYLDYNLVKSKYEKEIIGSTFTGNASDLENPFVFDTNENEVIVEDNHPGREGRIIFDDDVSENANIEKNDDTFKNVFSDRWSNL